MLSGNVVHGENSYMLRAGQLWHRIPVVEGYGLFLKERYGVDNLTLSGTAVSGSLFFSGFLAVGIESDQLTGEYSYEALDGNSHTHTMNLNQTLLLVQLLIFDSFEFDMGAGVSTLTRSALGYKDETILVSNLGDNTGLTDAKTEGIVVMFQALYRLIGNANGLDFSVRYTQSSHTIAANDLRPAYSETGVPEEQNFEVGGVGYQLSLTLVF